VPILLIGKIASGKTTAANILTKYGFKEYMFASPLKQFALSLGFNYKNVYGSQEDKLAIDENWNISAREFLQKFGTEVCREALPKAIPNMNMNGRTLWARAMENNIKNAEPLVISDGRFLDEAKLVRDYDGIIIRLVRNTSDEKYSSNHVSESSINEIEEDYVIRNNGSIKDLETQLVDILQFEGIIEYPKKMKRENIIDMLVFVFTIFCCIILQRCLMIT